MRGRRNRMNPRLTYELRALFSVTPCSGVTNELAACNAIARHENLHKALADIATSALQLAAGLCSAARSADHCGDRSSALVAAALQAVWLDAHPDPTVFSAPGFRLPIVAAALHRPGDAARTRRHHGGLADAPCSMRWSIRPRSVRPAP